MASQRIRIMLCESNTLLRACLRSLLNSELDMEVVGTVASGEDALLRLREWHPDAAVVGLTLPGMDGAEATRRILAERPGCHVLALITEEEGRSPTAAMKAGAWGWIGRSDVGSELAHTIRAMQEGMPSDTAVYVAANPAAGHCRGQRQLSDMEERVLELNARGYASREIAAALGISPGTVETYVRRAMHKLGLHGRTSLTFRALHQGLAPKHSNA